MLSQPTDQAAAFYRQVARSGCVWTLRDTGGFPAPLSTGGQRAQPFWSSAFRVMRVIRSVPAFRGFEPVRISWEQFRDEWLPGLDSSGLLVGVNWSGAHALGYDMEPQQVLALVERAMRAASERLRDAEEEGQAGGPGQGTAAARTAERRRQTADADDKEAAAGVGREVPRAAERGR